MKHEKITYGKPEISGVQKEWLEACKEDMEQQMSVNFPPHPKQLLVYLVLGVIAGSAIIGIVLCSVRW